jgi:hypothetical protein
MSAISAISAALARNAAVIVDDEHRTTFPGNERAWLSALGVAR